MNVRRLYRQVVVSPAMIAETAGARLMLMCSACMIPRDLDVNRAPGLKRWWSTDLEEVFSRTRFRCRCGKHAIGLRVTRPTRDSSETLLTIGDRSPKDCGFFKRGEDRRGGCVHVG